MDVNWMAQGDGVEQEPILHCTYCWIFTFAFVEICSAVDCECCISHSDQRSHTLHCDLGVVQLA